MTSDCAFTNEQRLANNLSILQYSGITFNPANIEQSRHMMETTALKILEKDHSQQVPISKFLQDIQKPGVTAADLVYASNRLLDNSSITTKSPAFQEINTLTCMKSSVAYKNGVDEMAKAPLGPIDNLVNTISSYFTSTPSLPPCKR